MSMIYATITVTAYSAYESNKARNKYINSNIEFARNRAKINRAIALEDMKELDYQTANKMNQISFEYEKARNKNVANQAMTVTTGSSKKKVLFVNRLKQTKQISDESRNFANKKIAIARESLGREVDTMETVRKLNSQKKSDLEILMNTVKAGYAGYSMGSDILSGLAKLESTNISGNITNTNPTIDIDGVVR